MTEQNTIRWDQDADGIVTLTLDDPTPRANTMTLEYRKSMQAAVDRLYAEKDSITGVIVTSAKNTFFAGGNLTALQQITDENAAEFLAEDTAIKADLRRLEKLGARSSPRSTVPRSAAVSRSRWPATVASRSTTRRRRSACPRSPSACCPAAAASCAPCACSASSTR